MSILDGAQSKIQSDFSGPNQLVDEEDIREAQGLFAQDVEYVAGRVQTRRGFGPAFYPNALDTTPGRVVQTFANWLSAQINKLIYYAPDDHLVTARDLSTGAETVIVSGVPANVRGAFYTQSGYRIYITFFGQEPLTGQITSVTETIVWDPVLAITGQAKIFPGPLYEYPLPIPNGLGGSVITDPASLTGQVTFGPTNAPAVHYFGVILTSVSGAESRPGPADAQGNFSSATATVISHSIDNRPLLVSFTYIFPAKMVSAQLVATTSTNFARWFKVPGQIQNLPGTTIPGLVETKITFTFNISDVALAGDGSTDLVTAGYFTQIFQDPFGNGPIQPYISISFAARMVYVYMALAPDGVSQTSNIMISEKSAPERATLQYHQIYLPDFRLVTFAFVAGNTLYLGGPHWTYAYSDNGLYPAQWATPRTVSIAVGTPFPKGVSSDSAAGTAWVVNDSGLFYFSGATYASLPASYYQTPDWSKINFDAPPEAVHIADDPIRRMVLVSVPFGAGQMTANKILAWDYTNGVTPDRIKYCGQWNIDQGAYQIGGMGVVYSPATKNKEIYLVPARGTTSELKVRRQKYPPVDAPTIYDIPLYDDDGVGIDSQYRHGPLYEVNPGPMQALAVQVRARGNGMLGLSLYSMDAQDQTPLAPASLDVNPKRWFTRFLNKQSESVSLQFDNQAAAGSFFFVTAIKSWFTRWMDFK